MAEAKKKRQSSETLGDICLQASLDAADQTIFSCVVLLLRQVLPCVGKMAPRIF